MSLSVPIDVLALAADPWLKSAHSKNTSWRQETVRIESPDLTDARLASLAEAAAKADDKSFGRVIESIIAARSGDFKKAVPKLTAFPEVFTEYMAAHFLDGWLYEVSGDRVEAYLVTGVRIDEHVNPGEKPSVSVSLAQTGALHATRDRHGRGGRGLVPDSIHLEGTDVARKRIDVILLNEGYFVETPALRAAYDAQTEHHREILLGGFTEQYRFTGTPKSTGDRWSPVTPVVNRRVINDTEPGTVLIADGATSRVFLDDAGDPRVLPVPLVHHLSIFDLATQEFSVVHSFDLTRYEYDKSLADKLVLPSSHRDLLDILTADLATFTGDIVEGKTAGNVVLAKGVPGVGKTLTAEVYAEIIERPLYSIHSGSLGVTAKDVRDNLEVVFKRSKRWNAVLLLDEADVFVNERGTDITQNAIVAEFLRTMEYFDGLMFMTTNRASNVDEAVISRCAAIIAYEIPVREDAWRIWKVLGDNFGADLTPALIATLQAAFSDIAPRDIKMLLRLALRVAAHDGTPLTADTFRRVAMFRGLTYHQPSAAFDPEARGALVSREIR